ncbi:major facilitator superfamily domain-containing protein [Thelonectria olida]|uniref:Major facilitator superfamily domain-containing protein n=1 Tax=Thelonectria olida TaxID=1576542 RepID=A0A9P8W8A0_9HYPO|nr:major facilitator superfamily domain-containing protein [Thelonectria olida]
MEDHISEVELVPMDRPSASSKHASMDVSGSVFFISSSGQVLRLPIPSTSPRDPLTWSRAKRFGACMALQCYSGVCSFEVTVPGILSQAIQHEFQPEEMGPFSVSTLSSAMTLFMGFGYLFSIPISTAVGRRPVFLTGAAITTISTLWAGLSGSFVQLLVAICLQAIAVGTAISMCQMMILDATFIHERPMALSLYWCAGSAVIKLFLVVLPFTTDLATQWRPVYEIWFAPCLLAFIIALLFLPETFFLRPPVALDGRVLVQSASEKVQIYEDWAELSENMDSKPLPDVPQGSTFLHRAKVNRAPGTTWRSLPAAYMQMLLCLCNPLIVWVALLSASILSGVIYLNLTQPGTLISPPWSQDPERVSIYLGVSGILGSLLAIPAAGPLISWSTRYFALRRNGIRHAEVYLPGFIPPVLCGVLSVGLFYLVTSQELPALWHYVASALSIMSYVSGNVAIVLWMTEAFPNWAAAALAVQMFTTNMVSFGTGALLLPAVNGGHIKIPALVIMGLILGLGAIALPVSFWGKSARQYIHGRWSSMERTALRPQ